MALSTFPLEFVSPTSRCSSSSSFVILHPRGRCSSSFRTLSFSRVSCSQRSTQLDTPEFNSTKKKKKRKPKPSFFDQIREKWSTKSTSLREKLPWQEQEQTQKLSELIEEEEEEEEEEEPALTESESDPVSFVPRNFVISAPWIHGNKTNKTQFDSLAGNLQNGIENDQAVNGDDHNISSVFFQQQNNLKSEVNFDCKREGVVEIEETPVGLSKTKASGSEVNFDGKSEGVVETEETPTGLSKAKVSGSEVNFHGKSEGVVEIDENPSGLSERSNLGREVNFDGNCEGVVKIDENPIGLSEKKSTLPFEEAKRATFDENSSSIDREVRGFVDSSGKSDSVQLPWERGSDLGVNGNRLKNRNTMLAEKSIPEPELKRLRKVSLRMVERIKVGAAGVTQALVDSIHEKWKEDEVVKLKFEGLSTLNMKRTHEILESRTGGLVIWRSGGSVVLYRGMSYKLPCVQSYTKQNQVNMPDSNSSENTVGGLSQRVGLKDSFVTRESLITSSATYLKDLSKEEIIDLSELNHLLDELGPRFKDWSGPEPLPVDADLLPSVVPGYKRPFRLFPHGVRRGLTDKQMTFCRRTARTMPPHFALGRNRELQGLAMAMVRLWERSSIAKIAIKRGVLNTCNERMAEEIKILTGGTLLSRNKDYIVFYRGNDFLPPAVTKTLVEAQKQTILRQDEEEQARWNASTLIPSNTNAAKSPLVAGTLAETMAAASRWGSQPTSEAIEKMKRDSALARHASLVSYLEKKLALAKGKVKKAEKALAKVQESLKPADLPTDLETISDEERFLFRKMGLSMKPYLVLGRRGIFDGTVENIHLHWKYRELVKIMVERKSFPQVKHIAISLEAESGGVLVSVDKTTKGYLIILYRGKNYQRPSAMRPKSLLTRRQAFARSIELQRREALKHHISDLMERIKKLKSELEDMMTLKEIDEETFNSRMDNASDDDDNETAEDEDEEAYLETYDSSNEE